MEWNKYKKEIKQAILIRQFETKLLQLFSEGKINGTVHTCVGEELTPVLLSKYMTTSDYFLSNHRGHGHFIAKTGKVYELMAEMMGRVTGISSGYGGSQHLYTDGFISNGVQGGMTPVAAGIGLAMQLEGRGNMAVSFLGDGTLGEGIIYEAFNLCGIWELPVLYVLENNHYAQSTSGRQTFAGDIQKRAEGFGLQYYKTSVWDIENMDRVFENVVADVRKGHSALIEIDCYRLNSHSKGDDNRDEHEIQMFREKDLIHCFAACNPEEYTLYLKEAEDFLNEIVEKAQSAPVFTEVETQMSFVVEKECEFQSIGEYEKIRGNESIYRALKKLLAENNKSVFLGEDIAYHSPYTKFPYGGAFKVSRDLSDLFPLRVRNTPISESAITGVGIGLALMGYISLVEIMFGDFMTLTLDQLFQHASKFSSMYGRKIPLPLVIRTPMGGRRGYGPTHSQSIEKFFLGIPDLNVVAIHNALPAEKIYENVFAGINTPTLIIENKIQYTRTGFSIAKGFVLMSSDEELPTMLYRPDTKALDLTIVCYGGMLEIVKKVVEELAYKDVICEIVCPTQIVPLNIYPVVNSVTQSGRILIVEEGCNFAAFGSEILAYLCEHKIPLKSAYKMGNNSVIPCSYEAENNLLPNEKNISEIIKSLV